VWSIVRETTLKDFRLTLGPQGVLYIVDGGLYAVGFIVATDGLLNTMAREQPDCLRFVTRVSGRLVVEPIVRM
jgi:hypothetical protein